MSAHASGTLPPAAPTSADHANRASAGTSSYAHALCGEPGAQWGREHGRSVCAHTQNVIDRMLRALQDGDVWRPSAGGGRVRAWHALRTSVCAMFAVGARPGADPPLSPYAAAAHHTASDD